MSVTTRVAEREAAAQRRTGRLVAATAVMLAVGVALGAVVGVRGAGLLVPQPGLAAPATPSVTTSPPPTTTIGEAGQHVGRDRGPAEPSGDGQGQIVLVASRQPAASPSTGPGPTSQPPRTSRPPVTTGPPRATVPPTVTTQPGLASAEVHLLGQDVCVQALPPKLATHPCQER